MGTTGTYTIAIVAGRGAAAGCPNYLCIQKEKENRYVLVRLIYSSANECLRCRSWQRAPREPTQSLSWQAGEPMQDAPVSFAKEARRNDTSPNHPCLVHKCLRCRFWQWALREPTQSQLWQAEGLPLAAPTTLELLPAELALPPCCRRSRRARLGCSSGPSRRHAFAGKLPWLRVCSSRPEIGSDLPGLQLRHLSACEAGSAPLLETPRRV